MVCHGLLGLVRQLEPGPGVAFLCETVHLGIQVLLLDQMLHVLHHLGMMVRTCIVTSVSASMNMGGKRLNSKFEAKALN